jgi:5'-nucleotidase
MDYDLIALFDMDGTLFDYEGSLREKLEEIQSPNEPKVSFNFINNPPYLKKRIDLITSSESFWEHMPKLSLGWDVLRIAKELNYQIHILTQGPRKNPSAWSGKKKCIDSHFGEDFNFHITRDKGLVYGTILVDDYPDYIRRWLKWRKNGRVIMPANDFNATYVQNQVTRYDGTNLEEVTQILKRRN